MEKTYENKKIIQLLVCIAVITNFSYTKEASICEQPQQTIKEITIRYATELQNHIVKTIESNPDKLTYEKLDMDNYSNDLQRFAENQPESSKLYEIKKAIDEMRQDQASASDAHKSQVPHQTLLLLF